MEPDPFDLVCFDNPVGERRVSARRRLTIPPDEWQRVLDPVTGEETDRLRVMVVINKVAVELVLRPIVEGDRGHGGLDDSPELRVRRRRYHLVALSA